MRAESLPKLALVPLEHCVLHESVEPERVARLVDRLTADDLLRNPPIVARYERNERMMVLDGATRTTALRQLGLLAAPVQLIDYADKQIELQTWAHLLQHVRLEPLLQSLRGIQGLHVHPAHFDDPDEPEEALCSLQTPGGEIWALQGGENLTDEARLLGAVFHCYIQYARVQRVAQDDQLDPARLPGNTALMTFVRYSKRELLSLTQAGGVLPAGITRHIIPGRVLRLNVPLAELRNGTLATQQQWFDAWVNERIAGGHARLYSEPTWLFDE